jgi:hypothetical protein
MSSQRQLAFVAKLDSASPVQTAVMVFNLMKLYPEMTKVQLLSMFKVFDRQTGESELDPEAKQLIMEEEQQPKNKKKNKKRKKTISVYTSLAAKKPAIELDLSKIDPDEPIKPIIDSALDAAGY